MLDQMAQSYYDLLEIQPDASAQDIRAAYLRAKAAYRKDSVALYTLISEEETDELVSKIEEAYQILSNPDRRREYDRSHGRIDLDLPVTPSPVAQRLKQRNAKIISIDRSTPKPQGIQKNQPEDPSDLLIAPATDVSISTKSTSESLSTAQPLRSFDEETSLIPKPTVYIPAAPSPQNQATKTVTAQRSAVFDESFEKELSEQTEWKGLFLRKVREMRRVALEEIADYTKISKTYILAIEEENFSKLPAPVYLRGFVIQLAKFLKLPHDQVATAYMTRYHQSRAQIK